MTQSPAAEEIRYEVEHRVATITLNRPDKLNALTPEMATAYLAALDRADADRGVRAVVITGAGRGFCAGADLEVLAKGPNQLDRFATGADLRPERAATLAKPVVAAVNGAAAGIGFALALAADIRFAAAGAKILPAFPRLGLVAEYGSSWLLPRLVGLPWALDLLLSGRTIDAEEAHRIGLVQHVVPREEVLAAATSYARDIADNCSPRSLQMIKKQLYADVAGRGLQEATDRSKELMRESFRWPDLAEGLAAQQDRRLPVFPDLPD